MKEIVTYTYEAFDGKMFDDKDECRDYELAEKAKTLELTMLNYKYETLPNTERGYEDAMVLIVNKQEDIDFIKEIARDTGISCPWATKTWLDKHSSTCLEEKLGIYMYDDDCDGWVNFDDKFAEIKDIYNRCFSYRVC